MSRGHPTIGFDQETDLKKAPYARYDTTTSKVADPRGEGRAYRRSQADDSREANIAGRQVRHMPAVHQARVLTHSRDRQAARAVEVSSIPVDGAYPVPSWQAHAVQVCKEMRRVSVQRLVHAPVRM
jgi:hypothetical protein